MPLHESIELREDQIGPLQLLVQLHQKPGDAASLSREVLQAVDNHIKVNTKKIDAQAKENQARRVAEIDAAAVAYDQSLTYHPEANSDEARAARDRLSNA